MKKLKIISIIALILSTISMIWGIGVVCYYVENLFIRGTSVAILIASSIFVSNTVGLVFKESK
ncbi:hypothetical protein [Romboutsia sp. 1001713B170131_170501_G6]|uniref:hypothetical protein n=1 Tax=Romboutsia sp. 1001713B170131_170501_G6 TaxID=2787108 RepID=UPI0018AB0F5C|nr:hypothetical protein [Romboutsia sp. 1001713B170131_170501_G6]